MSGPLELAKPDQLNLQYNTNLIGPILLIQAVLPTMRAAKSGVIVDVTRVLGRTVLSLNSFYEGSKYGLEIVSEAATIEFAPFGTKARPVEPGAERMDIGGNAITTQSETVRD